MSRITKEEVIAICEQLNAKGTKPTVIKVRELLGKGSYSTITKHLAEWEPDETESETPETPESLNALVPLIWNTCYKEAEEMFIAEKLKMQHEIDKLKAELESAQTAVDKLESEYEDMTAAATDTIKAWNKDKAKMEKQSLEIEHLKGLIEGLEKSKTEPKKAKQEQKKGQRDESGNYINPDNPKQKWSGRGVTPKWFDRENYRDDKTVNWDTGKADEIPHGERIPETKTASA